MICPVCNGMEELSSRCGVCGNSVVDEGRATDWLGPYAPYSPPEQPAALASAGPDASVPEDCQHAVRCPACGAFSTAAVPLLP